ncbi:POLR protein, partial [Nothocercus nigrocapillus]|nr:POLR protein [Nothocercus nigrocapillus]
KTFDSVSHQHIFQVWGQKGVDQHIIGTIKDLYTNSGTTLELGELCSESIKILRGMKQGDPLSPVLFNLAIDPLLCYLEKQGFRYKYGGQLVTSLAFADDLVLLTDSWENMHKSIQVVEEFCHWTGLRVQAQN